MAKLGGFKIDGRTILGKKINEIRGELIWLVNRAYETSDFESKSGNLVDSYGAALYYDKQLVNNGIAYLEPKATANKEWYGSMISGHNEMIRYFRDYKPKKNGITVVLIAAMPYAEVLERGGAKDGSFTLERKYKVITGANSLMQELADRISAKFGRKRGGLGRGIRTTITSL